MKRGVLKAVIRSVFEGHVAEFLYWLEYTAVFAVALDILDWGASRGASNTDLKLVAVLLPLTNALNPIVVLGLLVYGKGKKPYWWCHGYFPALAVLMLVMSTCMPPCSNLPEYFRAQHGVGEGEVLVTCPAYEDTAGLIQGDGEVRENFNFFNVSSPGCYLAAETAEVRWVATQWPRLSGVLSSMLLGAAEPIVIGKSDDSGIRVNVFAVAELHCMCQEVPLAGGNDTVNATTLRVKHYRTGVYGAAPLWEEAVQMLPTERVNEVEWGYGVMSEVNVSYLAEAAVVSTHNGTAEEKAAKVLSALSGQRYAYLTGRSNATALHAPTQEDTRALLLQTPLEAELSLKERIEQEGADSLTFDSAGRGTVLSAAWQVQKLDKSRPFYAREHGRAVQFLSLLLETKSNFSGYAQTADSLTIPRTAQISEGNASYLLDLDADEISNGIVYDWDAAGWQTFYDQNALIDTVDYARTWERVLFLYVWLVVTVVPFAGFRFGEYKRDHDLQFERSLNGHDNLSRDELLVLQQLEQEKQQSDAHYQSLDEPDTSVYPGNPLAPEVYVEDNPEEQEEAVLSDGDVLAVVLCHATLCVLVFGALVVVLYTVRLSNSPSHQLALGRGSFPALFHAVLCVFVYTNFAMAATSHTLLHKATLTLPRRTLQYSIKRFCVMFKEYLQRRFA